MSEGPAMKQAQGSEKPIIPKENRCFPCPGMQNGVTVPNFSIFLIKNSQNAVTVPKKHKKIVDFGTISDLVLAPKIDSKATLFFCCFLESLTKRCSNDFDLQNDSEMEPISTIF